MNIHINKYIQLKLKVKIQQFNQFTLKELILARTYLGEFAGLVEFFVSI